MSAQTAAVEPADLSLTRLKRLEQQVATAEHGGLRARWEFGHQLLAARDGKGRLPNGYLTRVCEETGASRAELTKRMQFADRFPAEPELRNAITQFGSWFRIVRDALPVREDANGDQAAALKPIPEGAFRVVVADPPWQYGNKATRGAAEDHYPTMTIEELCALDVEDRVADDAHLYLWVTNGFLREGFDVMDAWGFAYKTCLTWVKPQMGMGNYFRSSTEHVLFGVRGSLRTQDRALMNWFQAPRGRHSEKPGSFYDLVERASDGPYLEMFARRRRLGWSSWGNEA